jgi:glycosyltransferase involved in cell wall biosynthesis
MAAGTPVVATDLPSIRSLVTHGQNGWLVPPGDAGALAEGIRTVLDNEALAAALVKSARVHVQQFSWTARAGRLKAYLEGLADQTNGAIQRGTHA